MQPPPSIFPTSEWTLVQLLHSQDERRAEIALERLCAAYHRPLYNFARASGIKPHDAEDAVQDFFAHVLGNDALKTLDQEKGRIRAWMVRAFSHKLQHHRSRRNSQKRGGGIEHVPLDFAQAEHLYTSHHARDADPAHACDLTLALELWHAALRRLDAEPRLQKRPEIYAALRPCILTGWPDHGPGQPEVATRLGITANALKVRLHNLTAKALAEFEQVARDNLDPLISQEEIRHLWALLA